MRSMADAPPDGPDEALKRVHFRAALETKNVNLISKRARALAELTLSDALDIIVVLAETKDPRFDRAAARFAARVTVERGLTPSEAHRVLGLAESLREAPRSLRGVLRGYC
jgi:hypothetical protein